MSEDNSLLKFLEQLDTEAARLMLQDLKDPARRTPQLYNAINNLLNRHKFQIAKLQPEGDVLGSLAESLKDFQNSEIDPPEYTQ
ncbi:DNA packaging protein A [Pasteurella phage vB_PmuP_Pa7]|uniref:DNA packaging protein A n=1 Tax=Pasteurella phage vB_PmuP_Pa7 TaxID=2767198 RepID=A0A7G8ZYS5_9CAUD|nr:DNA packaging protein A [Pasteurella phage vB_PmuP_Pa7]